ncbi:MAG: response regulator [Magnetococcales bacterium]|nr:response regulator [Magnetococcales bacterium]
MNNKGMHILVVEDDVQIRRFLRTALTAREFDVTDAVTLREARLAVTSHPPEIILLDLGMPDGDGIDFTRELREWSHVPIIVISARGREDDKVIALDAGADDYLTKPFGVNELMARIRVAMRHTRLIQTGLPQESVLELGPLSVDPTRREVKLDGRPIVLTPIEYRLLLYLVRNAGRVLTHRHILQAVWGKNYGDHTHTLRVFMAQLRRKLESDPARPQWIKTEVGVGYRMLDLPE